MSEQKELIDCPDCNAMGFQVIGAGDHEAQQKCFRCKGTGRIEQKRLDRPDRGKLAWYILDEIAVKHSASHPGEYRPVTSKPLLGIYDRDVACSICDRAEEAMRLLEKPTHEECKTLYDERRK